MNQSLASAAIANERADRSIVVAAPARDWQRFADKALRASAAFWLSMAACGQLLFAFYVAVFYGGAAARGQPQDWNKVLQAGYVAGDNISNLVLASHLLFALVITVGGLLQLVPAIRQRWPRFHRWNGRVYLLSTAIGAVGGLIMIWTRNTGGDLSQHVAISINALLILGFAGLALRDARARRFDTHRRWALRLFLCASGGWFFRVGLAFWVIVNRAPVGFDPKTFTGPFLTFLSFAQYLVPLGVLQLYFIAQRNGARSRIAMAGGLSVLTLAMMVGIVAAAMMLWLPRVKW